MTDQSVPKFATLHELAGIVDRSTTALRNMIGREKIKPNKAGLYSVAKIMEGVQRAVERDLRNVAHAPGSTGDLKQDKLKEEIGILKVKRGELEKTLIPVEEHLEELRTMSGWFKDVFVQWISAVKVQTGDAKLVAEAERLRDNALARMLELIEKGAK